MIIKTASHMALLSMPMAIERDSKTIRFPMNPVDCYIFTAFNDHAAIAMYDHVLSCVDNLRNCDMPAYHELLKEAWQQARTIETISKTIVKYDTLIENLMESAPMTDESRVLLATYRNELSAARTVSNDFPLMFGLNKRDLSQLGLIALQFAEIQKTEAVIQKQSKP